MITFAIGDTVRLYDETTEHTIKAVIDGMHDGAVYYALDNGKAYTDGCLVLVRALAGGLPPLPAWNEATIFDGVDDRCNEDSFDEGPQFGDHDR